MAKIQFGAVVSDARNKVGGVVFSKSRFGNYIRKKVSPVQPRTNAQLSVRANLTGNSKGWSALTAAQRAGWIAFATANPVKDVFGSTQTLTGLQMYMSVNRNQHTIAQANIDDAPASLTVSDPGGALLASAAGPPITLTIARTNAPATGEYVVVEAAPPQSPGRVFIGSKFRVLYTTVGTTSSPFDIATAYAAKFGTLVSGQNISAKLYFINSTNGAKSSAYQTSVVVA